MTPLMLDVKYVCFEKTDTGNSKLAHTLFRSNICLQTLFLLVLQPFSSLVVSLCTSHIMPQIQYLSSAFSQNLGFLFQSHCYGSSATKMGDHKVGSYNGCVVEGP